MVLFPNAKINLGLNILRKRNDGFHEIESVFIPIGLCDILEFVEIAGSKPKLKITGIDPGGDASNNLVLKAWELMRGEYKISAVDIHLHKVIPVGAGLGGGSADAAFMLRGLNELFVCGASVVGLQAMAAKLGSDCAFFIRNILSFARGRGEILEEINIDLSKYKILLVNPGIHVGTAKAYRGIKPMVTERALKSLFSFPINEWQGLVTNDFEESVFNNYPAIADLKNWLVKSGAVYTSMSGSGSTVYGIYDKNIALDAIISSLRNEAFTWQGDF